MFALDIAALRLNDHWRDPKCARKCLHLQFREGALCTHRRPRADCLRHHAFPCCFTEREPLRMGPPPRGDVSVDWADDRSRCHRRGRRAARRARLSRGLPCPLARSQAPRDIQAAPSRSRARPAPPKAAEGLLLLCRDVGTAPAVPIIPAAAAPRCRLGPDRPVPARRGPRDRGPVGAPLRRARRRRTRGESFLPQTHVVVTLLCRPAPSVPVGAPCFPYVARVRPDSQRMRGRR